MNAGGAAVTASFVVPAKNESGYLGDALESVRDQDTDREYELIVVDGGSEDGTPAVAREHDAALVRQESEGRGPGRHEGALRSEGAWLAFVDADTTVRPDYLDRMLAFVEREGLAAASSRCRVVGSPRGKPMQAVINRVFPRLDRPILPGFNCFVDRGAYFAAGGFPGVPNEDTAFSRQLAEEYPVGYCDDVLVETSARRFVRQGLTGGLAHYLRLDWRRLQADY